MDHANDRHDFRNPTRECKPGNPQRKEAEYRNPGCEEERNAQHRISNPVRWRPPTHSVAEWPSRHEPAIGNQQRYEHGPGHRRRVENRVVIVQRIGRGFRLLARRRTGDAVAPTPVLGAGGIASGRQAAAAMALGAAGVWTGSVWLTVDEADASPLLKDKLFSARPKDAVRSRSLSGKPARLLRTAWTEAWEREDCPGTLPMPLQYMACSEAQARIGLAARKEGSKARCQAEYVPMRSATRACEARNTYEKHIHTWKYLYDMLSGEPNPQALFSEE